MAVRVTCLPHRTATRCVLYTVRYRCRYSSGVGDVILSGTGLRYRPHDYRRGGGRETTTRERGLGWGPSQNVSASDSSTLPPRPARSLLLLSHPRLDPPLPVPPLASFCPLSQPRRISTSLSLSSPIIAVRYIIYRYIDRTILERTI